MTYRRTFMKFKYTGRKMGNVQLAIAGVIGIGECLENGKIYDIPDDVPELIAGCNMHPDFEKVGKKQTKKGEDE